jgi:uncharacterized membrane protein
MRKKLDSDDKTIIIITLIFAFIILFSTILHHVFPWILQVPDVRGAYTIAPMWLDLVIIDVLTILLTLMVIYHGFQTQGKYKTIYFLYGAITYAGLEECFWILAGRFNILSYETYFFTRGGLWFFEIPLFSCLSWFNIAYCCYFVAKKVFINRNYVLHAFVAGIFAVSIDLFLDPAIVNLGSTSIYPDSMGTWVWLTDPNETFSLFSIPVYNFIGWFFVIFMFIIVYNLVLNDKDIEELSKTKTIFIYFGTIIVFIAINLSFLFLIDNIIGLFMNGIKLIPIGLV